MLVLCLTALLLPLLLLLLLVFWCYHTTSGLSLALGLSAGVETLCGQAYGACANP
jgi:hypothetical protein